MFLFFFYMLSSLAILEFKNSLCDADRAIVRAELTAILEEKKLLIACGGRTFHSNPNRVAMIEEHKRSLEADETLLKGLDVMIESVVETHKREKNVSHHDNNTIVVPLVQQVAPPSSPAAVLVPLAPVQSEPIVSAPAPSQRANQVVAKSYSRVMTAAQLPAIFREAGKKVERVVEKDVEHVDAEILQSWTTATTPDEEEGAHDVIATTVMTFDKKDQCSAFPVVRLDGVAYVPIASVVNSGMLLWRGSEFCHECIGVKGLTGNVFDSFPKDQKKSVVITAEVKNQFPYLRPTTRFVTLASATNWLENACKSNLVQTGLKTGAAKCKRKGHTPK